MLGSAVIHMMDQTRAKNISCNIGRAAQHEIEGDPISEMRFLLFVVEDIAEMLQTYRDTAVSGRICRLDAPPAKRYAKQMVRISTRVEQIIEDGV